MSATFPNDPNPTNFSIMVKGATLMGLSRRVVDQNLVDKDRALEILEAAHKNQRSFLREALENSEINRAQLLHCASEESGMPLMDLGAFDLTHRPIDLVDARFIEAHGVLPLFQRGTKVFWPYPTPPILADWTLLNFKAAWVLRQSSWIPRRSLEPFATYQAAWGQNSPTLKTTAVLMILRIKIRRASKDEVSADTPIVRFVNKILMDAIRQKASDIHIEPYEGKLRVRYRLDGVLP